MATEEPPEVVPSTRNLRSSYLSRQPEIEEVEEEDTSPGSDQSDTTITAGNETPRVPEGESPESCSPDDLKPPSSHKHNHISPKLKQLTRSEALTEDCASPPPDPLQSTASTCSTDSGSSGIGTSKSLTSSSISGNSFRGRLEKDGSQSSEAGTSSSLSRDSSVDTPYKDSTGIDLEDFIKKTLNKTPKDRSMLVKLEVDLIKFIREPKHHYLKFPQMSSYDRMLVHRIAAFFGLDHNVDQTGKCVIVNKTQSTRIPDFSFQEHLGNGVESKPKMLLKRGGGGSFDENQSRSLQKPMLDSTRAAKSLEERQQMYEEVRSRIFTGEEQMEGPTSYTQEDAMVTGIVKKLSRPQSLGSREDHTWSSTESSGYGTDNSDKRRILVPKANSFGGTGTFVWKSPRLGSSLSKADSMSMSIGGLQPSMGSPYVRPQMMSSPTLGQSDSSSSTGSASNLSGLAPSPQQQGLTGSLQGSQKFYWVASDLNSIPPGSVVINPQTGQPFSNADGSAYHYTPGQPLPTPGPAYPPSPQPQVFHTGAHTDWTNQSSQDSQTSQHDLCQQLSVVRVTPQSSIDSNCGPGSGDAANMTPQHVVINQNIPQQQPQPQTFTQQPGSQTQGGVYYPGAPSIPGQTSVRYICPVNYGTPLTPGTAPQCMAQGHNIQVDGQTNHGNGQPVAQHQYCQQYVQQGYTGNQIYPMTSPQGQVGGVGGGQGVPGQSSDMTYQCGYNVTSPTEGQGGQGSLGYNYSVPYHQQQQANPNPSQVYYTVQNHQSNQAPQQGFMYNGQQGTTYQTNTTPPSQNVNSNVNVNPNVQLNNITAQPVNVNNMSTMNTVTIAQQQPPGVGVAGNGASTSQQATPQQFITYPSSLHTMNHATGHQQAQYPHPVANSISGGVGVQLQHSQTHNITPQPFHTMYRQPNMQQMPMHIIQQQQQHQQQQQQILATKSPHQSHQPPQQQQQQQHSHVTVSAKGGAYEGVSVSTAGSKVENGSGENVEVVAAPEPVTTIYRPQPNTQGEIRLQYPPVVYRPQVPPVQLPHTSPHLLHKSPMAPKPQRIKKSRSRDSQQSSTDKGCGGGVMSNILEVTDLPPHLQRADVDSLLQDLITAGANLQLVNDLDSSQGDFNSNSQCLSPHVRVFAIFPDSAMATSILNSHSCNSNVTYKLHPTDSIGESLA